MVGMTCGTINPGLLWESDDLQQGFLEIQGLMSLQADLPASRDSWWVISHTFQAHTLQICYKVPSVALAHLHVRVSYKSEGFTLFGMFETETKGLIYAKARLSIIEPPSQPLTGEF